MKRSSWFGFLAVSTVLVLAACGGKDKPPLTPDSTEDPALAGDGGAPAAPEAPATPAAPAK